MKYLFYYLIVINIITFILYGLDKLFAIKEKRRISERTLLVLPLIGGIIGIFSMYIFHHKTKKWYFNLICIISLILWGYLIYYLKIK